MAIEIVGIRIRDSPQAKVDEYAEDRGKYLRGTREIEESANKKRRREK